MISSNYRYYERICTPVQRGDEFQTLEVKSNESGWVPKQPYALLVLQILQLLLLNPIRLKGQLSRMK